MGAADKSRKRKGLEMSRPQERRALPNLAAKLTAKSRNLPLSRVVGDFIRIVTEVPDASNFQSCARFITSGPIHAKFERQLRSELGLQSWEKIDFRVVARESDESRAQIEQFRRYRESLPAKDRQVWSMWHGIRSSKNGFDTDASRIEPLDPSKITPNAKRAACSQNRLGDGIYFASHLSYNVRGGFYEVNADTGAVKLLQCLVLPGNYHHLQFGSDPSMTGPPQGYDSRIAYVAPNSPVVIACISERDALFVQYEIHIFGIHSPPPMILEPPPVSQFVPVPPPPASILPPRPAVALPLPPGSPWSIVPPVFPNAGSTKAAPIVIDDSDDDDVVILTNRQKQPRPPVVPILDDDDWAKVNPLP